MKKKKTVMIFVCDLCVAVVLAVLGLSMQTDYYSSLVFAMG